MCVCVYCYYAIVSGLAARDVLFIYFKSLNSYIIVILITSQGYHQRLPLQLVLAFHSHCSLKRIDSLCSSFLISIYCMYAAGSLKRKIYIFYILSLI